MILILDINQIEEIKKLRDRGYNAGQISRELGISRSTVKNYLLESESSEPVEPSQRTTKKSWFSRPPVITDPSPKLKEKREEAETADLQVSIEKKSKELEKIKKGGGEDTGGIKKKEDEVKVAELTAKEIKIKNEIRKMEKNDREEAERENRKELLERVKLSLIPPFLRNELPSPLLAITLSEITGVLLPLINLGEMSEGELKIYGKVIRDKVWSDPKHLGIIKSAQQKVVLNILKTYLKECIQLFKEEQVSSDEEICSPIELQIRS